MAYLFSINAIYSDNGMLIYLINMEMLPACAVYTNVTSFRDDKY